MVMIEPISVRGRIIDLMKDEDFKLHVPSKQEMSDIYHLLLTYRVSSATGVSYTLEGKSLTTEERTIYDTYCNGIEKSRTEIPVDVISKYLDRLIYWGEEYEPRPWTIKLGFHRYMPTVLIKLEYLHESQEGWDTYVSAIEYSVDYSDTKIFVDYSDSKIFVGRCKDYFDLFCVFEGEK